MAGERTVWAVINRICEPPYIDSLWTTEPLAVARASGLNNPDGWEAEEWLVLQERDLISAQDE